LNYRDECASKFLNELFNGKEITRDNFEIDGQNVSPNARRSQITLYKLRAPVPLE